MNDNQIYIDAQIKPKLNWASLELHNIIKALLLVGLLVITFWPALKSIVGRWAEPNWSHGFIIPFFSLYFLNQKKQDVLCTPTKTSWLGFVLLTLFLIYYPLNIAWFKIGTFNPLSFIACLASLALFMCGWRIMKYLWLPIFYLFFAVPIPTRIYREITTPLRKIASYVASELLDLYPGVTASSEGVIIDVYYKGAQIDPLNVADACSGMRLLMAFVALGVAMAYLHDRPLKHRITLFLSTIPIAIICNVVRVTVTGFIYVLIAPKYAEGIYHDMLGILMLFLAFGLYAFIAWIMNNLFEEEHVTHEQIIQRNNG